MYLNKFHIDREKNIAIFIRANTRERGKAEGITGRTSTSKISEQLLRGHRVEDLGKTTALGVVPRKNFRR